MRTKTVVVLGMMSKLRVAGAVWQTLHYLVGLRRLGYEVYYVEAHGCRPWAFQDNELAPAAFIDRIMRRFDFGDRWAFHARSGSGHYYGMTEFQVRRLYREAAAVINLHGGTAPVAEQLVADRFVYIDTDPTFIQVELHDASPQTVQLLEGHSAFFTFGENYGRADCRLPVSDHFRFQPTRQPVVVDFWEQEREQAGRKFTTIGNWRQLRRVVEFHGQEYQWSKHHEFLKFLELPTRTAQEFELALSSYDDDDRALLEDNGWAVRDASTFSLDLDPYRNYIRESRGEFTVAKDQNIRLRTGWFSDRSATYLAAGRPVITQETGYSSVLPTGEGLFSFSTMEDILTAVEAINSDHDRHSRAAREIAHEYFAHGVVLTRLLSDIGLPGSPRKSSHSSDCLVNVIGQISSPTGLGTTVRRYAAALESIGVDVKQIDLKDMGRPDVAAQFSRESRAINLICCDVATQSKILSHTEQGLFRGRYNIGLWVWELPTFPKEWHDRFAYYDEIWTPTSFLAAAFAPVSPVPVTRIPHVLETANRGVRQRGRLGLGLEPEEFTFAFVFDFHSGFERKNPLAVIAAFKAAFKPEEQARLVLKCAHPDFSREHFAEMNRLAEGRRVSIYSEHWTEEQILDLTAACDCYVSLHRAEGVGLTMSDAMAAGKPVIATGWSGNMDFMNVSNSFPVRYRMATLDRDVGHYRAGETWAEPSVEHAAEMMRYVFEHRSEAAERARIAEKEILDCYSRAAVGKVIANRLAVIAMRPQFGQLQEDLKAPIPDLQSFLDRFSALDGYVPVHNLRYQILKRSLQAAVQAHVPPAATVAVVSRGDDELLDLGTRQAVHFPQGADGQYAGYYPRDSAEAIQNLEVLRTQGGDFLVFPDTSLWWLDHYPEFRDHLERRCSLTYRDDYCTVFGLSAS